MSRTKGWDQAAVDRAKERMANGGIYGAKENNPELAVVAKANLTPRDLGMNKTETKFSLRLEALKRAGHITEWRFEALKFRLADMTTYTPDFLVIGIDGSITLIDTKAYWKKAGKVGITEDANVKVKVVAEQYPWFVFQTTWEQGGGWQHKTY